MVIKRLVLLGLCAGSLLMEPTVAAAANGTVELGPRPFFLVNRLDDGRLAGDVDFAAVRETASALTPVPGGVGPMTIAMLLQNTLQAARLQSARAT